MGGMAPHGGERAAGAPPYLAGAGGDNREAWGGNGGDGGEAGEGSGVCLPAETCRIPADCDEGRTCVGSSTEQLCVPEQDYCDPQLCVQRSAGCLDHRCLPALPLGATCENSHQCGSGLCDRGSRVCVEKSVLCGCQDDRDCGDGATCVAVSSLDPCQPSSATKCVPNPAPEGSECNPPVCAAGLICGAEFGGTGIERCHAPSLPLGAICEPSSVDYDFQCAQGLYCGIHSSGAYWTCQALGEEGAACPCQTDLACGGDQKCHALAAVGESCGAKACQHGLRCVSAIVDGACCHD